MNRVSWVLCAAICAAAWCAGGCEGNASNSTMRDIPHPGEYHAGSGVSNASSQDYPRVRNSAESTPADRAPATQPAGG